jgi:hypothetical protein
MPGSRFHSMEQQNHQQNTLPMMLITLSFPQRL